VWVKWAVTRGEGKKWWRVLDSVSARVTWVDDKRWLPLTEEDERKVALLMMLPNCEDGPFPSIEGVGRHSYLKGEFLLYEEYVG